MEALKQYIKRLFGIRVGIPDAGDPRILYFGKLDEAEYNGLRRYGTKHSYFLPRWPQLFAPLWREVIKKAKQKTRLLARCSNIAALFSRIIFYIKYN